MTTPRKVVFLDRDGTINIDHGYVAEPARWEFVERAPEALRLLRMEGYALAVITNQAGVADGRFTVHDVERLHEHMQRELQAFDVAVDAIAFCPHARDAGCVCRKPRPGMSAMIERTLGPIDYAASWAIGDKESDVEFGAALGCHTALIRSRYWSAETLRCRPEVLVDSLYTFARDIAGASMQTGQIHWRLDKFATPAQAGAIAAEQRRAGRRVVTTNGSFDLLHPGHLDQLEEARKQGDLLIVGVNNDAAIRAAKGSSRPFLPEQARAAMLAALACVDYVVIMPGTYAEEPMRSLLEFIQPDVHVNGPDYGPPSAWLEWSTMRKFGTQGHVVTRRNSFSTSGLVDRIRGSTPERST